MNENQVKEYFELCV